ncbi:DNA polymerase III subunit alpha [Desulfobacterota bacterium AH_259_B03_O07]|nr:DNA polymerase III subunit alpha [Desulfobacterota bacterium AH_259_B03_O07]
MAQSFVHLHLHSQYSLLDGAIKFEELFSQVRNFGMDSVALTDHGNLFGAFEFFKKAKEQGIKPIIGCEVYITPKLKTEDSTRGKNYHLILLSTNREGYKNLSNLVTRAYFEGFYRKPRIDHEILENHSEGLIALSGCLNGELCKSILGKDLNEALKIAARYKEMFGDRYYLEVQANGLPEQDHANQRIKQIGEKLSIPLVATNDCHFLRRSDSKPHDVLLCIQTGTALEDEKRFKFKGDEYFLKSPEEMLSSLHGFEQEIERTLEVADRCNFEFETKGYKLPVFQLEDGRSHDEYLAELSRNRLDEKLKEQRTPPELIDVYKDRLRNEIKTLMDMGFSGYILVVSDFINFAKSSGIPVGPGRGSAAGSLVAYALDITEIDPIPYNLIFERFLNPERISMPDIDVDFCGERRDEVIRYVTEKYGSDKVAQIGTFGTMSAKAVVKDVGRVLGIPYAEVDRFTKLIPSFRGKVFSIDDSISQVSQIRELIQQSPDLGELVELARPLENMVRHSSTHAAGVVISSEPLADYIPLYKGSKNEVVTQYDMNSIEDLGFVKFDFLGLKTLTVIDKAIKLIEENHKTEEGFVFDKGKIPLDDPEVYRFLSKNFTRGVFQIESTGMRDLLLRLEPSNFADIIAILALYRPGPLDSGMVDEFIKRKHGEKKIDYPLPELEDILKDTYGLFVYQEQIMNTASLVAGYSLGEADLLRRAMGKKKSAEFKAQRQRFLDGAKKKGISNKKAKEIFDTLEKFAEYSFNKSHSTAYALITYQTAYLKTHFRAEFMAALLSSETGNTDKVISSIAECREMGIEVLPPDVNESVSGFTAQNGKIRFGLSAIKNVGQATVEAIINSRHEGGKFSSIFDFCEMVNARKINKRTLESLTKSGAFDSLGINRAQLIDSIESLITYTSMKQKSSIEGQNTLFTMSDSISLPSFPDIEEWSEKEMLSNEMEVLGFYVTTHPMAKYISEIEEYTSGTDTELIREIKDRREVTVAGVVRSLKVRHTKNGSGIFGNLVLEDMKGSVEVVIFNDLLRRSLPVLEDKVEPVIIKGTLETNEERVRLRATNIFSIRELRNGTRVQMRINDAMTREGLLKLKDILKDYPGNSPVHLRIISNIGEAVIELGDFRVDIQDKLIDDLESHFGKGVLLFG